MIEINKIHDSFEEISEKYKALLFDVYGVIEFGRGAFARPVFDFMRRFMARGGQISIVSNSPFPAKVMEYKYAKQYGNPPMTKGVHYNHVITSEQYFHELLVAGKFEIKGHKVYPLFYPEPGDIKQRHSYAFDGLGFKFVDEIHDADFIYLGFPMINGHFSQNMDDFIPELEKIKGSGKPMICTNPDFKAHVNGQFMIMHGFIADWYAKNGGSVIYFGKPDPAMFIRAMADYVKLSQADFCMIGDTIWTDCAGANAAGIDSCLVLDGGSTADSLTKRDIPLTYENIVKNATAQGIMPTYIACRVSAEPLFNQD